MTRADHSPYPTPLNNDAHNTKGHTRKQCYPCKQAIEAQRVVRLKGAHIFLYDQLTEGIHTK
jgi:hypothetical protein